MQRKLNGLMLLFSLIGGGVGFIVGEIWMNQFSGKIPTVFLVGGYFGGLALCIGMFCLLAEMISPKLNGASWRQRYMGTSWKLLLPSTLILLLLLGTACEFVYELNINGLKPVKNIVLIIDNSGSMEETDPTAARYEAAKNLIHEMDSDKEVAIILFNDKVDLLQPFVRLRDQSIKDEVISHLDGIDPTNGGTDIGLALAKSMEQITQQDGSKRGAMAILLSDGYSDVNREEALRDYIASGTKVNTIGLDLRTQQSSGLLQDIANRTGGRYYDVSDSANVSMVFQQIYNNIDGRTLLTERVGSVEGSTYYMILRIFLLILLGTALGLSLGILFDNRHLAKSFSIGGAVAGMIAGAVLEFGLGNSDFHNSIIRLLACLILAVVIALFTLIVPMKDKGAALVRGRRNSSEDIAGGSFKRSKPDNSSRGF
jgi:Ca-activated chloride channel family protein